ncbi:MAG: hypothetical protein WBM50_10625 [Acidimicrobiales bacterium]
MASLERQGEHIAASVGDTRHMENENDLPASHPTPDQEAGDDAAERAAALEAFDLDGDGKVSNTEAARANLGVIDAGLQTLAKRGGIIGKLAAAAHRVLDRFDND